MHLTSPERLTPAHHFHLARGAQMGVLDGWQVPTSYGDVTLEAARALDGAGIYDISPVRKFLLYSCSLDGAARALGADEGVPLAGSVARWDLTSGEGHDLAWAARTAPDELFVVTGPAATNSVKASLEQAVSDTSHVVEVTSGLAGVALVGPRASNVLAAVTELDVAASSLGNVTCAQAAFARVRGTLLRIDVGNLPVYELYFDRSYGDYMWEALLTATGDGWPVPVGAEAMGQLR